MIRALSLIAATGLFVSLITISAAVGITGPNAIAHGAWTWSPAGWGANDVDRSPPKTR